MNSGDLNADGKTDLFAIDADSYRLDTFYGRSDRTFASYSQQLPSASYWSGAEDYFAPAPAMADFNDDGRNDIATITTNNNGLIYLIFFLATPSPGQFTLQTWNVPNATGSFELPQVGDFNHDGKPDWVFNANISPAGSTFYTGLNSTVGLWSNCDYPTTGRGIHVCSPDVSSGLYGQLQCGVALFRVAAQDGTLGRRQKAGPAAKHVARQRMVQLQLNPGSRQASGRHLRGRR